mgnify:CR=1 FL=1
MKEQDFNSKGDSMGQAVLDKSKARKEKCERQLFCGLSKRREALSLIYRYLWFVGRAYPRSHRLTIATLRSLLRVIKFKL